MPEALLAICDLHFGYDPATPLLRGINLTIEPGQTIGLRGANGSGKTTLFRCLTGLEKISKGEIRLKGKTIKTEKDFRCLRRSVGFSLQNAEDQLILPTVFEDVSFGPLNLGLKEAEARAVARATLASLNMAAFEEKLTHELSGGQQKLVALAAVLAMQPELLLLDEPFNGLDAAAAGLVADLLANLKCAKIITCHNNEMLAALCQEIWQLENGRIEKLQ